MKLGRDEKFELIEVRTLQSLTQSKTELSNTFATRHMWRMAFEMWRMASFSRTQSKYFLDKNTIYKLNLSFCVVKLRA